MERHTRDTLVKALLDSVQTNVEGPLSETKRTGLAGRFQQLLEQHLLLREPPAARQVTVLLADLRSFTTLTESLAPEVTIELLNRYFACICEVALDHGGHIDKFMGDSLMVLFGAPTHRPDDLRWALRCAVRMQQSLVLLNKRNAKENLPQLYAGIGINTGEMMAGSFGSELYSEYTVVGAAMNLAARIEAYSLRGQILISRAVRDQIGEVAEIGSVNSVRVKGKQAPIELFELCGLYEQEELLEVPRVELRRAPRVDVDLQLAFRLLRGKHLEPFTQAARVVNLSYNGMRIVTDDPLPSMSEIGFELRPYPTTSVVELLYARVLRCEAGNPGYTVFLEFTSADTPGHAMIKEYVDQLLWGQ